jgi:hypothetical protein
LGNETKRSAQQLPNVLVEPMEKNPMIFGVSRDPGFQFLSLLMFEKKT